MKIDEDMFKFGVLGFKIILNTEIRKDRGIFTYVEALKSLFPKNTKYLTNSLQTPKEVQLCIGNKIFLFNIYLCSYR